jgi:valyl-tRNA synthetase
MASSYNPTAVEAGWYSWWEKSGFFKPEFTLDGQIKPEGLFVLPAPPPNVTGILHNGHALTISIQDAIVRWSVKTANGFYFIDCCNRQFSSTLVTIMLAYRLRPLSKKGFIRRLG